MKHLRHEFEGTVYFVYHPQVAESTELPLLMIHGHGGDHEGLSALAQNLNTTVIIPDLPGFGESKELEVPHTIENYVQHLEKLMDKLGYTKYIVMGHSLGSAIALTLATTDLRVQKLILLNPIPEFTAYIQKLIKTINGVGSKMPVKIADALVNARLYNLATFLLHSRKRNDASYAVKYLKAQNNAKYSFKTWSQSGESIFYFDHMKAAEKVRIPTLVLHGDRDSLTTLSGIEVFTKILAARLVRIPKAGHFLPLEHIDEAATSIKKFMKEPSVV
jgi:pimeloyl-ACP methyl ester carboxylesterase